jgi:hypothetical protein
VFKYPVGVKHQNQARARRSTPARRGLPLPDCRQASPQSPLAALGASRARREGGRSRLVTRRWSLARSLARFPWLTRNFPGWRGLRESGAWEDGLGRAWRGGKENRGKPQEAARWLPGHGGPVSHIPGFPSHRALVAWPDSLVPDSRRPRRFRAPPGPSNAAMRRARDTRE